MSQLSDKVEVLLKKLLPIYDYSKEYPIKVRDGKESTLFFDFRIPSLRIMIEVQGKQHSEFNKFFHGNIDNFNKSRSRDAAKVEWCRNNNYSLVYFYYDEIDSLTEDEFLNRILTADCE